MAEWIPPKTNWSVEDVPGLEDFKRIEGNLQYLKDYCPLWYGPSNELLIESLSEKMVKSMDIKVMKSFRLQYPGIYKMTFQARREATHTQKQLVYANVYAPQNETETLTTDWKTYTFTFQANANMTYYISGHGKEAYSDGTGIEALAVYIRNVRIFGSPVLLAAVPASFILE